MSDNSQDFPEFNEDDSSYPEPFHVEPEDGSPDFDGPFDTDPTFLGQVDLTDSGEVFANVYSNVEQIDSSSVDLFDLRDIIGDVDDSERRVHFELEDLPDDFDFDSPDVRGPFPDEESVANWLDETGLWDIADWYYDADNDEYYIEIGPSE